MCIAAAITLSAPAAASAVSWEFPNQQLTAESGDTSVAVVFKFRIEGESPVTFGRIAPSCGCTIGELERSTWQPGETGELTAHFRVGEREGTQRVSIRVSYTSPQIADDELAFSVDVRPWAQLQPRLLWWRHDEAAEARRVDIRFAEGFANSEVEIIGEAPESFAIEQRQGGDGALSFHIEPCGSAKPRNEQLRLRLVRPDGRTLQRTLFLRVL